LLEGGGGGASKNGSLGALGRFGRRVVDDSSTFEVRVFIRRVRVGDGGLVVVVVVVVVVVAAASFLKNCSSCTFEGISSNPRTFKKRQK